jgi:hypothetical protein
MKELTGKYKTGDFWEKRRTFGKTADRWEKNDIW